MTSSGQVTSSITLPFDSPWSLSYKLPVGNNPLSPSFAFLIIGLKDVYTDMNTL